MHSIWVSLPVTKTVVLVTNSARSPKSHWLPIRESDWLKKCKSSNPPKDYPGRQEDMSQMGVGSNPGVIVSVTSGTKLKKIRQLQFKIKKNLNGMGWFSYQSILAHQTNWSQNWGLRDEGSAHHPARNYAINKLISHKYSAWVNKVAWKN